MEEQAKHCTSGVNTYKQNLNVFLNAGEMVFPCAGPAEF
jgi:hypothetical protein